MLILIYRTKILIIIFIYLNIINARVDKAEKEDDGQKCFQQLKQRVFDHWGIRKSLNHDLGQFHFRFLF